ncbi:hypothetical protein Ciccas_006344 [Cichlidogyrus casuarinus]|uniref:Uncharacterized protein n=1 Tax=Cichlidogyrus casuarinus TaxID=1844966 RepID=A0ABD2Q713_9PLAT
MQDYSPAISLSKSSCSRPMLRFSADSSSLDLSENDVSCQQNLARKGRFVLVKKTVHKSLDAQQHLANFVKAKATSQEALAPHEPWLSLSQHVSSLSICRNFAKWS